MTIGLYSASNILFYFQKDLLFLNPNLHGGVPQGPPYHTFVHSAQNNIFVSPSTY